MNWNKHLDLKDSHAFLGASKYHWINYDEEKLIESFDKWKAAQRGTELHEFAANAIRLGIKLQGKSALSRHVNDAIIYRMQPEQILYYSENCYGTADAISFRKNVLRIQDLKTGVTPASMAQLEIYASLFCLEYHHDPGEIKISLHIYQNDEIESLEPEPEAIREIMGKIIIFDKVIDDIK